MGLWAAMRLSENGWTGFHWPLSMGDTAKFLCIIVPFTLLCFGMIYMGIVGEEGG